MSFVMACDPSTATAPTPIIPVTRTYVLSTMDVAVDDTVTPARSHGFDLDGLVDGDTAFPCTHAIDLVRRTGESGIDNQFGSLVLPVLDSMVAGGIDESIRLAIQDTTVAVVIEVSGIDSFSDDPSVRVRVLLAAPPGGALVEADGAGLASGQVLDETMDLGSTSGRIANDRLESALAALPFRLQVMGTTLEYALHDARLSADVSSGGSLRDGELGGAILVADLVNCAFLECPTVEVIETLAAPDLGPDATGAHCSGISMGAGFEAVTAVLR